MKPSMPQGTRDFDAGTVRKRLYLLAVIRRQFELFGFAPLETPAMENLSTLTGKYGEEGDKLMFKVLNNGLNEPKKHEQTVAALQNVLAGKSDAKLTERALKYDLTIPFARYVAMNQGSLVFPFKRYQMQPVWRADRPQRGRYREFLQCDADVVGSHALEHEAELLMIYANVFRDLKLPQLSIKVNNRKILAGLAEAVGQPHKLIALTIAMDKLEKIGYQRVIEELAKHGFEEKQLAIIDKFLRIEGSNDERLQQIRVLLQASDKAQEGCAELKEILDYYALLSTTNPQTLTVDFSLARGLDYYTGMIVEVATTAVQMGSLGGGGRYDDLTSMFGLKNMSGVGISFGIDRIYDVMEELALFPNKVDVGTQIMFLAFDQAAVPTILTALSQLRQAGIAAEFYPERGKYDKQLKYVHRRAIPYAAIIGSDELAGHYITMKQMDTGVQSSHTLEELIALLQKK